MHLGTPCNPIRAQAILKFPKTLNLFEFLQSPGQGAIESAQADHQTLVQAMLDNKEAGLGLGLQGIRVQGYGRPG